MVRRCEFCDSPVPADATVCPICHEEIAVETLERVLPMLKRPESSDVKAMGPLKRLYGTVRRPATAFRDIAQRPDTVGPFLIIIMNALVMAGFFLAVSSKFTVSVVVNQTTGRTVATSILFTEVGTAFLTTALFSILPNLLLGMLFLVLGSIFAHLAFKVTGGTGSKGKTVSIVGYSMFPVVLIRLIGLILILVFIPAISVENPSTWSTIVQQIYNSEIWTTLDYLTTASFVWVGFLLIFGIREAHETSTIWAFVVSVLCIIVLGWTFWQVH